MNIVERDLGVFDVFTGGGILAHLLDEALGGGDGIADFMREGGGQLIERVLFLAVQRFLLMEDFTLDLAGDGEKTVVFGLLIGVTGCYCGMHAHGGTEGVGRAATRAVVVSIFLVLVSDALLVKLIQLLF